MYLNLTALKFIDKDGWRLLQALEEAHKSHEYVPKQLAAKIARLRNQGIHELLGNLMHHKLVAYEKQRAYEGYRLTWLGFDFLALHTLIGRGLIDAVGPRIGVGKEADVHIVSKDGKNFALKLHRLGRTSFRSVKKNRDYLRPGRGSMGWLHLSRLSAQREFDYLKALNDTPLPVPEAVDYNRHCVIMGYADGLLLNKIKYIENPQTLARSLLELVVSLAKVGIIHGDFNEFNLIVNQESKVITVIDFPQVISIGHPMAEEYFNRDVKSIVDFFGKRTGLELQSVPTFKDAVTKEMIKSAREKNKRFVTLADCAYSGVDPCAIYRTRTDMSISDSDDEDGSGDCPATDASEAAAQSTSSDFDDSDFDDGPDDDGSDENSDGDADDDEESNASERSEAGSTTGLQKDCDIQSTNSPALVEVDVNTVDR